MECLADVLSRKYPQFNTVSPRHALRDALYQLSCEHLDYLVVCNDEDFVGILSEQDVAHKLFLKNKPIDELAVADIMNDAIPVCNASDSIDATIENLNRYNSRYVAVFDEFAFKGIVSENDLLKRAVRAGQRRDAKQAFAGEDFHWAY